MPEVDGVAVIDAVADAEAVAAWLRDDVTLPDCDCEGVAKELPLGDSELVAVDDPEPDGDTESDGDAVNEPVPLPEGVDTPELVAEDVLDPDGDDVGLGDEATEAVPLSVLLCDGLPLKDGVDVSERDTEGVLDVEGDAEGEGVCVREGVELPVPDAVTDALAV